MLKPPSRRAFAAAALVALGISGAVLAQDIPPPSDQAVSQQASNLFGDPASPSIGAAKGVPIVEFFDYDCSYCKATEPRLEALVKADKTVRLVLKEFPILGPASMTASRVALAAARQGKYAAFHQELMSYRGPLTDKVVYDTATRVGLDMARVRRDMNSPAVSNEIIANFNLARALRIFQTPGYIVGTHFLTGPSAGFDFPKAMAAARGA